MGSYTGKPEEAFWYFDEEIAHMTEQYEAVARGLKPELIGFEQNCGMVPQTNTHLQVTPVFAPRADGITFELHADFYDRVPAGSPRLPGWAGAPVDSVIGHASGGGLIVIQKIQGPFEQIGPNTFEVHMERETLPSTGKYELVFAATHPGDTEYKAAVQQAHMYIPAANSEGAEQSITFPAIPSQKAGRKTLRIQATSSAGVPVFFTIREGPATVSGDTVSFASIPPRAKFPVAVTVIAWRYGSAAESKLKSATPVLRTFLVTR